MLIGIVGHAGSGKDVVAGFMVERGFASIALADPMKAVCQDVFGWSKESLWGPSELRSMEDKRSNVTICNHCGWFGQDTDLKYPYGEEGNGRCPRCQEWDNVKTLPLSPRIALQILGTQFGRALYPDIWIDLAIRRAKAIMDPLTKIGNVPFIDSVKWPEDHKAECHGVAISDVRFANEMTLIKENGGKLIHVTRPSADKGSTGISGHASETEQDTIPNEWYDLTLNNSGTIADLETHVDALLNELHKGDSNA